METVRRTVSRGCLTFESHFSAYVFNSSPASLSSEFQLEFKTLSDLNLIQLWLRLTQLWHSSSLAWQTSELKL